MSKGLFQHRMNSRSRAWLLLFAFIFVFGIESGAMVLFLAQMKAGMTDGVAFSLSDPELPPAPGTTWHSVEWETLAPFFLAGLAFSAIYFAVALFFRTRVDKLLSGRELRKEEAPGVHRVVEAVATQLGLPKPRIVVVDEDGGNVFAHGLRARSATLVITRGALRRLNREELRGVVAHALLGIRNGDMQFMTMAQALFDTALGKYLREMRENPGKMRLQSLLFNISLVPVVLFFHWRLASAVIAIWISSLGKIALRVMVWGMRGRARDAETVEITHDPEALVSAMMRLDLRRWIPDNEFLAALGVVGETKGALATHPPLAVRVRDLMLHADAFAQDAARRFGKADGLSRA